ncbi:cuticle collagen 2-like [Myiozetetes cayanensis]|uniref:cuticle collagen 2-like n=1 Tax=Myiozetetes cayanensis TaxID=478635 RepID=UPI00215FC0C0|nr:cuticle collagen 2-like [Myiozetetes cayanensis]XP_050162356.1 cuticle collagen 2-like [Myiozetetes cayanensis]
MAYVQSLQSQEIITFMVQDDKRSRSMKLPSDRRLRKEAASRGSAGDAGGGRSRGGGPGACGVTTLPGPAAARWAPRAAAPPPAPPAPPPPGKMQCAILHPPLEHTGPKSSAGFR